MPTLIITVLCPILYKTGVVASHTVKPIHLYYTNDVTNFKITAILILCQGLSIVMVSYSQKANSPYGNLTMNNPNNSFGQLVSKRFLKVKVSMSTPNV